MIKNDIFDLDTGQSFLFNLVVIFIQLIYTVFIFIHTFIHALVKTNIYDLFVYSVHLYCELIF